MKVRTITVKQSRVLSDHQFGNYQAEACITVELIGAEQDLVNADLAYRRVSAVATCRVLDDVHNLERWGKMPTRPEGVHP